MFELLNAKPHERILDLGCGNAELTLAHLAPRCDSIVGLDSSPDLLETAKSNLLHSNLSESKKNNINFVQGDGQHCASAVQGSFDAVFSNAAMHWMKDSPESVPKNVYQLLKPGGRFVSEMGGGLLLLPSSTAC